MPNFQASCGNLLSQPLGHTNYYEHSLNCDSIPFFWLSAYLISFGSVLTPEPHVFFHRIREDSVHTNASLSIPAALGANKTPVPATELPTYVHTAFSHKETDDRVTEIVTTSILIWMGPVWR